MKKILLSTLAGVLGFFILYLVGCFATASFNIGLWSTDNRYCVSVFGTIAFIACFAAAYNHKDTVNVNETNSKIEALRSELKKLRDEQKLNKS